MNMMPPISNYLSSYVERAATPTGGQCGAGAVLQLPMLALPVPLPRPALDFSLVEQIDGLIYCMFGLRLERDVMASALEASLCLTWGCRPYESLGTSLGLYFGAAGVMPQAVAVAASHRACGVFIVPRVGSLDSVFISDGKVSKPWWSWVTEQAKFVFLLPANACNPPLGFPAAAVLTNFGRNIKFKSKRPAEARDGSISLECCVRHHGRVVLPPFPDLLHRVSPRADADCPGVVDDVAVASRPFAPLPADEGPLPLPRVSPWSLKAFEHVASTFPFPSTAALALEVMNGTLDPFCGDRTKTVDVPTATHSPEHARLLREKMVADVACGFVAGPFSAPPYSNARTTNVYAVPKEKYVPSTKIRPVHNLSQSTASGSQRRLSRSKAAPGSINALCFSPHFLSSHLTVRTLCNVVVSLGHGTTFSWGDVPKAFKHNPSNSALMFLHVTKLLTEEQKLEFYVECANSFGWVPSEWGWQAVLALIKWWLECNGVTWVFAFVDNFWHFHPPGTDATSRRIQADAHFEDMGLALHEQGAGTHCDSVLGWEMDLDFKDHPKGWRMVLICKKDKYDFYLAKFSCWKSAESLSLKELATMAGAMQWLAGGFPAGAAFVAPIIALRSQAEREEVARRAMSSRQAPLVALTEHARDGVRFFATMLDGWDRTCPIVADFGPTTDAERLGWVDAATDEGAGCGGIYWDPERRQLFGFVHVWSQAERAVAYVEQRMSTGVLEAMALERWLVLFGSRCAVRRTLLHTDNEATMIAFEKAFSSKESMRDVLCSSRLIMGSFHIMLRVRQVKGIWFNRVADRLSHGRVEEASCLALELFGVPLVLLH